MTRGRGDGSFRTLPDGRIEYRVSLGSGPDGSRQRHRFYGRTQGECRAKAEEYRHSLRAGLTPPDGELLREYLYRWLEGRQHELRPRTYIWYRSHIEVNLVPAVGDIPVADLQRRHVRAMVAGLRKRGLSPRSANAAKATLGAALQDALVDEVVTHNAARLVHQLKQPRSDIHPLTASEIERFRDAFRGTRDEALYTLALSYGLRQGELLGLTWADVDFARGLIRVTHTLRALGNSDYALEDVKTETSNRVIVMPPSVATVLKRQRDQQDADRARMGDWWPRHWPDLVFREPRGAPLYGATVTRRFQRILAELGIPRRRFHDLRHTCATYLLMSGVEMKVIQQILGHATIAVTANVYAHVLPQMQEDALGHMGRLLSAHSSGQQPDESPERVATTVQVRI